MSKKKIIITISCVLLVLSLIASGSVALFGMKIALSHEKTTEAATQATRKPAQQAAATPDKKGIIQPQKLTRVLKASGHGYDDIKNSTQLITVYENDDGYVIECFECSGGEWRSVDIKSSACVGKNGTIDPDEKTEGDYCSPQGLYSLGFAFGTKDNPGTAMEYRSVYDGVYWVDDVESPLYNQWVETGSRNVTWNSAEKMWTYDEYNYGVVVNYNTDPVVKNKGSAIFLHVGSSYTAGCVASDEQTIVAILKWLTPDADPMILIN